VASAHLTARSHTPESGIAAVETSTPSAGSIAQVVKHRSQSLSPSPPLALLHVQILHVSKELAGTVDSILQMASATSTAPSRSTACDIVAWEANILLGASIAGVAVQRNALLRVRVPCVARVPAGMEGLSSQMGSAHRGVQSLTMELGIVGMELSILARTALIAQAVLIQHIREMEDSSHQDTMVEEQDMDQEVMDMDQDTRMQYR